MEVGLTKTPAESAKVIIAEVNQQMPRTLGDSFIHVSRLNYIVPVNYPIPEMAMGEEGNSEVVEKIAGSLGGPLRTRRSVATKNVEHAHGRAA